MIVKGASRSNGLQLGQYLLGLIGHKNDAITVLGVEHLSDDLMTATRDMQASTGSGQRGQKGLYHAQISPAPCEDRNMTPADWIRCADILETQLGLDGQARVMVLHEKAGRIHLHVAWQRYDLVEGKLRSDSWNYIKHELAARQMEKELGHEAVKGVHLDGPEHRSDQSYDMGLAEQAGRSKRDPVQLKKDITAAWLKSDTGQAFSTALADQGLILAKGERRAYVVVDEAGEIYTLSRQVRGTAKTKDLKARLSDLEPVLPTQDEAREIQRKLHPSDRLSQEADTLARKQAGERLRLTRQQRNEARHFVKAQKQALKKYDDEAREYLASRKEPPPGKVFALFLRITGTYDQHLKGIDDRTRQRETEAKKARGEFKAAQQEVREEFRESMKTARREMLHSHNREQANLPEHEQALIKKRISRYMAEYQGKEHSPEDDRQDRGGDAGKSSFGPLRPGSKTKGMPILPPSRWSDEEREAWEKEKRRRAEEAQQRKDKDTDKDHER